MTNMKNLKNLTIAALLTSISILIPVYMPKIVIPPSFSVTLASHVPVILAMFISPLTAVLVAIGSAVGFLFALANPVITARAATHVVFAFVGSLLIERYGLRQEKNLLKAKATYIVYVTTGLLHAVFETLVLIVMASFVSLDKVFPATENAPVWLNFNTYLLIFTGITFLHHTVDFLITLAIYKPIAPYLKNFYVKR